MFNNELKTRPPLIRFTYWFLLLMLFSSLLIFYHLGSNSLHNSDEGRYAIVTKEMLETNDWITLHSDQKPYFAKPPLRFWLTAPLCSVFGYSEWVLRFWSAAAAVGCVALTCLIGKELFGPRAGLWAGFALATSIQFVYEHCAKTGEMDSLTLFS